LIYSNYSNATHLVGGDLYYTCLGQNNYQITLKIFRDCFNGQAGFDSPAFIFIFDANNNQIGAPLTANPSFPVDLPTGINSNCFNPPTTVCAEVATYNVVVNLPPSPGGYRIVHQRCCRNGTIINLTNPGSQGSTYEVFVPDPGLATCNNSAQFKNLPPKLLCLGKAIYFDHSASDVDGDSIAYELCTPFRGASSNCPQPGAAVGNCPLPNGGTPTPPFQPVLYSGGYSGNYPINANPVLAIDPQTGLLTGTPLQQGQWVIGIRAREFRNGVQINEIKRDFQFNVINCPNLVDANFPPQTQFCQGLTATFQNLSFNASTYNWEIFQLPANTLVTTSTQANPTISFPSSGLYRIKLTASGINNSCSDFEERQYKIDSVLVPEFVRPAVQCLTGNNYQFQASGSITSNALFIWDFGANASPPVSTNKNPNGITFGTVGPQIVSLSVNANGCSKNFKDTVFVVPDAKANFTSDQQFCKGFIVNFINQSSNADEFFWNFGDNESNQDTSQLFEPIYTYADTGRYNVMLVAQGPTCSDTLIKQFYVFPLLEGKVLSADTTYCFHNHNITLQAGGFYYENANFEWVYQNTRGTEIVNQNRIDSLQFNTVGNYNVLLIIRENGCVDTSAILIKLYPKAEAAFEADLLKGCMPHQVNFSNLSSSVSPFQSQWIYGNGKSSSEYSPTYVYPNPGKFSVRLSIQPEWGCKDTVQVFKENYIEVYPLPKPGFKPEPFEASIYDPKIDIGYNGIGAIQSKYIFSDGDTVNAFEMLKTFKDTGDFWIKQILTNEFGCIDSVTGYVRINPEYRFFIPNTFTPNNDGLNDVFRPLLDGVVSFEMQIFNRWGQLVFQSNNTEYGWDGTFNNDKAQLGVYAYRIVVRNVFRKTFTFTGHLNLLR
jgi:gliding motility-associated-like protein